MCMTELIQMFVFPGVLFALVTGLLFEGIDRKIVARLQNRIGPPIWQNFLDFGKLMSKETLVPGAAPRFFMFAPLGALASLIVLAASLPIIGKAFFGLDNVILVIYFLLMSAVFTALAGFSSGNPFGATGAMRNITQVLAIEFPLLVAFFTPIALTGSFSLTHVLEHQGGSMLALSVPLAAIAFLIAIQGSLHKKPFDVPEAKQEILAGVYTEYTGAGLALFELAHALKLFVYVSLAIILFFGGAVTVWQFLLKFFLLSVLLTFIRAILARLKISQVLKFYWLFVGPLALIDLIRVMLL